MLVRLLSRKLVTHTGVVHFLFSQDPFDKFKRKRDANAGIKSDDPRNKPQEPSKGLKNWLEETATKSKKSPNQPQQQQNHKKRLDEGKSLKGFARFELKQRLRPKEAEEESNKSANVQSERQKGKDEIGAQKNFQKFNRKRVPPQNQKKSNTIPTTNIDLNDNETDQGQILRRPKRSIKEPIKRQPKISHQNKQQPKEQAINAAINNQPIEPNQPNQLNQCNQPNQPIEPNQPNQPDQLNQCNQPNQPIEPNQPNQPIEPMEPSQPIEPNKPSNKPKQDYWDKLQSEIRMNKAGIKRKTTRYQNSIRYDQTTNSKPKKKEQEKIINHQKNYTRLIVAGVALFILSNKQYFILSVGTEKDPQYLKEALDQNRIEQTWIRNIEVSLNNDEQVRGNNFETHIYILEKDGKISYCPSNQEFQALWFKMVANHNQSLLDRATGSGVVNADILSKGVETIKTINIGQKRESKKSSPIDDLRNILSMVMLYYFIKSIMEMRKAGKGAGGKGATALFGKQKSHRFKESLNITFKDVVGMQKAKEEIVQFIDFLKFPQKYSKLGARIPKGALLTGPPGTGKTMIAKACAGESQVPFFTISGSEFIEMYVGVGAQRVRNLFKQAKQSAPSIIFIDEIDAVGKKRSGLGGGNDERDSTLNQLLVEMDGFDTNTNVIVFAATNQKEVLDPALTRPGRFDRLIEVDLPDIQGRKEIFEVHLRPIQLDPKLELAECARRMATLTPGFSGADIKNVCNEAAIISARNNKQFVSILDFELATERIIGGVEKKSQLITSETRRTVAYHQCGHGVVSWFIQNANPLLKLTIIPRSKGALGFAQYLPNEHQMYTKAKLIDEICVILGGRISQEIFFGKISTGASDDLNKAYKVGKAYVTQFGFGDSLGWIGYHETQYAKQYSKDIQNKIDAQILELMRFCTERTRSIIMQKKDLIHRLAEKLLEAETIDQTTIESILGPRPFKASKQHEEYIKEKKRISEQVGKGNEVGANANMRRTDYIL